VSHVMCAKASMLLHALEKQIIPWTVVLIYRINTMHLFLLFVGFKVLSCEACICQIFIIIFFLFFIFLHWFCAAKSFYIFTSCSCSYYWCRRGINFNCVMTFIKCFYNKFIIIYGQYWCTSWSNSYRGVMHFH